MHRGRNLFVLLYAASGAAALVYEVTWTRLLTLQLGHTVAAASTVLAAFMGGLAVGAWLAGSVRLKPGTVDAGRARLPPDAGLRIILAVGVLLNALAAGGAWWLASRLRSEETAEGAKTAEVVFSKNKKNKTGSAPSLRSQRSPRFLPVVSPAPGLACAAAAISGFAALVY